MSNINEKTLDLFQLLDALNKDNCLPINTEFPFDELFNAVKNNQYCKVQIQQDIIEIIPNPFSENRLTYLEINGRNSNRCLPQSMKKLIKEWKDGKRFIKDDLLMVK